MSVHPRTKEICWKLIDKQKAEIDLLSDTLHNLANEAQVALMNKDRERIDRCKLCRRGLR